MATKRAPDQTTHEMTLEAIAQQSREFQAKRDAVTKELQAIFAARKSGVPDQPPPSDHAKATRARAIELLNGSDSALFLFPETAGREETLFVERDALDLVLKALAAKETPLRASAAAQWANENADAWRGMAREILLTAIRLSALEERARAKIAEVDTTFLRGGDLALGQFIGGGRSIFGWYADLEPLREPIAAALKERVITESEIRKAQDV